MSRAGFPAYAIALLGSTSAAAQSLPPGTYSFAGGTSGSCLHAAIAGYMVYPGPGKSGLEIGLVQDSSTIQVFDRFPPIPTSGLNTWTGSAPAAARFRTLVNNSTSGPTIQTKIAFDVTPFAFSAAQGAMTITGACQGDVASFGFTIFRSGRAL